VFGIKNEEVEVKPKIGIMKKSIDITGFTYTFYFV